MTLPPVPSTPYHLVHVPDGTLAGHDGASYRRRPAAPETPSRAGPAARRRGRPHPPAHGSSDLSLRELATAIGTSHRMLIYHFGSKEGLLVAVIQTVEEQQRDVLRRARHRPGALAAPTRCAAMWQRFTDPALGRPASGCSSRSTGRRCRAARARSDLLDGIVDNWVEPASPVRDRSTASRRRSPRRSPPGRRGDPRPAARPARDRRPRGTRRGRQALHPARRSRRPPRSWVTRRGRPIWPMLRYMMPPSGHWIRQMSTQAHLGR